MTGPSDVLGPKRPDLYVVGRFLTRLAEPGRVYTRGRLQAAVRLNFDLFTRYLDLLMAKGLVVSRPDKSNREILHLTSTGLEAYHQLLDWIRRVLGRADF